MGTSLVSLKQHLQDPQMNNLESSAASWWAAEISFKSPWNEGWIITHVFFFSMRMCDNTEGKLKVKKMLDTGKKSEEARREEFPKQKQTVLRS